MPIVLAGNKADMPNRDVTMEAIQEKQQQFGCEYTECSAFTGQGINNAFYSVIYEVLKPVEVFVKQF